MTIPAQGANLAQKLIRLLSSPTRPLCIYLVVIANREIVAFDCYRAMRERNYSTSQIGRRMGRDHSTVSHGMARVGELQGNLL